MIDVLRDRLPALLRPVPDDELPHLATRMTRGVRAMTATSALVSPMFALVAWASGMTTPLDALASALAFTSGFGFLYVLAGTAHGRARPQPMAFLAMLLTVAGTTFAGEFANGMNSITTYVVAVPLVASAFFPWHPRWSFGLGGIAIVGPLLLVPDDIMVPAQVYLSLGFTYTLLAGTANQVHRRLWLELEHARQSLIAFDRMSALGRMLAGIAHELKTPAAATANSLAHIKALACELRDSIGHPEVDDDDLHEITREIAESADLAVRATERCGRFLQAIRAQTVGMNHSEVVEFDVGVHVTNCVALLEYKARRAGLQIELAMDVATMKGDPGKFEQVVTNLLANGLEACATANRGTTVRVEIHQSTGGILLAVEDDGPGVPTDFSEQIFEPLFTTRTATGGTGLGLSIARDIVEGVFGGTLRLADAIRGARFEVWVPREGARVATSHAFTPGSS
ncbi:sensor histidine kinase [Nannocystaceae bacterium ST9]